MERALFLVSIFLHARLAVEAAPRVGLVGVVDPVEDVGEALVEPQVQEDATDLVNSDVDKAVVQAYVDFFAVVEAVEAREIGVGVVGIRGDVAGEFDEELVAGDVVSVEDGGVVDVAEVESVGVGDGVGVALEVVVEMRVGAVVADEPETAFALVVLAAYFVCGALVPFVAAIAVGVVVVAAVGHAIVALGFAVA